MRANLFDVIPKILAVIEVNGMSQLVDNQIVYHVIGSMNQADIEVQISL